jgi:hypothetical protein
MAKSETYDALENEELKLVPLSRRKRSCMTPALFEGQPQLEL